MALQSKWVNPTDFKATALFAISQTSTTQFPEIALVQLNAAVMLGTAGANGSFQKVFGRYEELLDDLLIDDSADADDVGRWIGTEEDIMLIIMQRDDSSFSHVRSGGRVFY